MCDKCEEKKDYGKTLNLPKTDFPMRANLPEREPEIEKEVFEDDLYEKMLKKNEGHESFVLHDGPPYANGEIHIGHALNKTLKDTVVRYKNLRGYYTPFIRKVQLQNSSFFLFVSYFESKRRYCAFGVPPVYPIPRIPGHAIENK